VCPLLTIGQLERTLGLLVQGEIDILLVTEEKETTGTKRKRKANKTAVWRVEQPNGPAQAFADKPWGQATRDFMVSFSKIPLEAMAEIISEASSVAMTHKSKTPKGTVPSEGRGPCDERATLAFR
jgi:hypothetical protein